MLNFGENVFLLQPILTLQVSDKNQVQIIGLLRAIAALMVCFYHFTWHTDPHGGSLYPEGHFMRDIAWQGQLGVYVFFVISGFVIPLSMYYGKYQLRNFLGFMGKRLARLHPPFVASMLLYGILEISYAIADQTPLIVDWAKLAGNFFLTAKFTGQEWIQDVYWTLAIEFQYYILVALIYPLLMHAKQSVWFIAIVFFTLSSELFDHDQKQYLFFHAPVFAMGLLLFLHHIRKISDIELIIMAGWCMIETRYEMGPEVAVAASITTFAIACMHWRTSITNMLGDASYSIYLIHGFSGAQFLYYTNRYAEGIFEKSMLLAGALALTICFALLFERIIERPSIRLSQRIKYKRPQST